MRAWVTAIVLLAAVAAGVDSLGCIDDEPLASCQGFDECTTCVMESACSFCLETNQCISDQQACAGDRAQTPDMCEEEP